MKKYNVMLHYEGIIELALESENETKAKELAEIIFEELTNEELGENITNWQVDYCEEE